MTTTRIGQRWIEKKPAWRASLLRTVVSLARTAAVLLSIGLLCGNAAAQGSGGVNTAEMQSRPYVILISIDGFRWDYQARYRTPNLDWVAAEGIKAESLKPVFPTLTFPNHYSIATGLYPARHGIVGNRFFDADRRSLYSLRDRDAVGDGGWYAGEPLWVAAERNGMVSAAYYFVGTEADIAGIRPSHWFNFNPAVPGEERVTQVLDWLRLDARERPHLITLYFEDVDSATHEHGVGSDLSVAAIERVDAQIGTLLDGIAEMPIANDVHVVIVSDHGMLDYRDEEPFVLSDVVNLRGVRVVEHGSVAFLYLDEGNPGRTRARARSMVEQINDSWQHGQAVRRGQAPDDWNIDASSLFADVIVIADPGYAVNARRITRPKSRGDHGWAPDAKDMHGIFLAYGSRIPAGRRVARASAVDVYPFVLEILGLPVPDDIDGDPAALVPLLRD